MTAPAQIHDLVHKFERGRGSYTQPAYNEAQLRQEFVNPFFAALGWDVGDSAQVLHEAALKSGRTTKHPDYSFLAGKRRAFYVETKKPAIGINTAIEPAGQLRSYGWSGNTAVGILTNFAEFAVYDCRIQPQQGDHPSAARINYLTSAQYVDRWQQLYDTLSREAVQAGKHRSILDAAAKGVLPVDAAFLRDMENWRSVLAEHLHKQAYFVVDQELSQRELNLLVQRTIDRIVFLRIAEDRNLEEYGTLEKAAQAHNVYERLKHLYRAADAKYNSGLFHFNPADKTRPDADTLSMAIYIPDNVLRNIINALYPPQSRYQFSVISADILGQVYERFLGKVIEVRSENYETRVSVVEKPEVRKAGGVYYTPEYIVDYIVENTVGKLLEGKTPVEAAKLRILDPACGSGSFLAGAYQYLLDWHLNFYSQNPRKHKNVLRSVGGGYALVIPEKRRILLNSIYGVDLDQNAVEVSKLSLLLKMLENEDGTDAGGLHTAGERILPDLRGNIKWGNSLVGSDFYDGADVGGLTDDELQRVRAFDWDGARGFADIMAAGGFDAVIGNPPYVRQETLGRDFKAYAKATYDTYAGTADLYTYFIERGVKLLRSGGIFGIIVANKWLRARYGKPLRAWLKRQAIREIIDFGDLPVFEQATTYPCILTIGKGGAGDSFAAAQVDTLEFGSLREHVAGLRYVVDKAGLDDGGWSLAREEVQELMHKLAKTGIALGDYVDKRIHFGIKSGLNKAFLIDGRTRDRLILDSEANASLIKPMLGGRDIKRYENPTPDKFIIVIPNGWTNRQRDADDPWSYLCKEHRAIAEWLEPYRKAAEKRWDKGDYWWELRPCDYYDAFEKPKLVLPDISARGNFTLDREGGKYCLNTAYVIGSADKYLLGILNSKLVTFFYSNISSTYRGGYLRFIYQYLERIPIRAIDFDDPADVAMHDEMVRLVERMLELHKGYADYTDAQRAVADAQIERVDQAIDELVYRLYGLSEEEVEVVEGG